MLASLERRTRFGVRRGGEGASARADRVPVALVRAPAAITWLVSAIRGVVLHLATPILVRRFRLVGV